MKHAPYQKTDLVVELSFKTEIGAMWQRLVYVFCNLINANTHRFNLKIIDAKKKNGKLALATENNDSETDSMIEIVTAYANKIDENTGQLVE